MKALTALEITSSIADSILVEARPVFTCARARHADQARFVTLKQRITYGRNANGLAAGSAPSRGMHGS
jgi:hypothetical protein